MKCKNNRVENFEALYCTLALLAIEMGSDDILLELFRLVLGIQVGVLIVILNYIFFTYLQTFIL